MMLTPGRQTRPLPLYRQRELYQRLGAAVRRRRRECGLACSTLAAAAGLAPSSIGQIEAGEQRVSIHTLFMIAEALATTPSALLPKRLARGVRR